MSTHADANAAQNILVAGLAISDEQADVLYDAVQARLRPEDVAAFILVVLGDRLTPDEDALLRSAGRFSWRDRLLSSMSMMSTDFARPSMQVVRQGACAEVLFGVGLPPMSDSDWLDGDKVLAFVREAGARIGYGERFGTKVARRRAGIYKNARWYGKRRRVLAAIERKVARYAWNQRKYDYTRASKSALAVMITREDLRADVDTACLVAYMAARMNRRSMFTNKAQDRAFDSIAQMLLARCLRSSTARWDVVAHILPDQSVLARLSDAEQGALLGRCWNLLVGMAEMLAEIYGRTTGFDLKRMIVERGQDSSSWNQVAGGWNVIRSQWISLLHALGAGAILQHACPGKVMRLMAADVARWHEASGGDLHPDTKVWATLPLPWDVLRGETPCSVEQIRAACERYGAKVETWVAPRDDRQAVAFRSTPELVHGVAAASPVLAAALRKAGVFSGKQIRGNVPAHNVVRDKTGAALYVKE